MKNILVSALILSGMVASSAAAAAAELYSLDARIGKQSLNIASSTPDKANKVRVPMAFLGKNHLFYLSITATSEADLDLGMMSDVTYVKHVVDGDKVKFQLAAPMVGDPNSQIGVEVASYDVVVDGNVAEIDLSTDLSFRTQGGVYKAEAPAQTRDAVVKADRLEYTQVFELKNVEPASPEAPPTITIAIRAYLLERENTAYQPRNYPEGDRTKVGYFSLSTFQGVFSNFPENDYAMRWDLSKPITYTLHPSVPAEYRARVTAAILSWNKVFKATTGKEPVRVVQGTDANILPGNPDTAVVYWFTGDVAKMYLGQARPMVDPRTGEIFTSYLLFSQSEFDGALNINRIEQAIEKAGAQQAQPASLTFGGGRGFRINPRQEGIFAEGDAVNAVLQQDVSPAEVLARMLDVTVAHELGHSLGLRHNFSASSDIANLIGTANATTVMDYVPTVNAPRAPQGYDYKAIAYGYNGQVPAEFNKTYAYASDEHEPFTADANRFDEGEPYAYSTGQFRTLRRARPRLQFLTDRPQVYQALLARSANALPKFLQNNKDPRFAKALEFHTKLLAFEGPATTGGGTEGVPSEDVPAEVGFQKNVFERAAVMLSIAERGQGIEVDAQAAATIAKQLEDILVDEDKSDVFLARLVTIPALVGLRETGLRALVAGTRRLATNAQANQEGPTIQQELALLQVIKSLFDRAQGGQQAEATVKQISPVAAAAFRNLDVTSIASELQAELAD